MAGKPGQLSENHWKALEMLDHDMERKDVAKAMGWTKNHLDQLCCGSVEKAGGVATLFKAEYMKIAQKIANETDTLLKSNLRTAQSLMKEVFEEIKEKKRKTSEDKKILSMYANAIAKCQPNVNIKNLSYSYTKGLSAEELVHEFKRLKTIAEQSFDRERVPAPVEGGSGTLPEASEWRSSVVKDAEITSLQPDA